MKPKDTKLDDWLCWFTGDKGLLATNPFRLDDKRRAATDGRFCVIAECDGPVGEPPRRTMVATLLGILAEPQTETWVASAEKLAATVGPCIYPSIDVCSACDGKKVVEHHCNCDLCEETKQACSRCDGDGYGYGSGSRTLVLAGDGGIPP